MYAVNPHTVSRYRGRLGSNRAKSDRGDAKVLADLVRTDRHNHRVAAGDSPLLEAVKVLSRAHQGLIWARQRHVNGLRSALQQFYPGALVAFGTDLAHRDAVAVLAAGPTPAAGRRLSRVRLEGLLRGLPRPVIGRVSDKTLWLDMRCLSSADEAAFVDQWGKLAP